MAEEHDVNTVVPGNPASGDEVTQAGNHEDDEVTQLKPTGTKATKLRVTDIERLLKYATVTDESPASILTRVLNEHATFQGRIDDLISNNEHLETANEEIRDTLEEEQQRHQAQFDEHVYDIGQLQARITTLENAAETAVVPTGLASLGIKDVIEETKDMCGDDDTCGKVMEKMIDLKAHFASKAIDHEHDAEQNQLDREQKELDRKSKEDLAEKERKFKADLAEQERKNKIELALAKKGGFKEGFLDDVVFLGGGTPKRPGKEIERRKQQARHAADDEEELLTPDDFDIDKEEELLMPEDE